MTNSSYDLTKDLDKVVVFDSKENATVVEENITVPDTIKDKVLIDTSKSAKEILEEVGSNKELALDYLKEEKKADKPRTTLIKKLEEVTK